MRISFGLAALLFPLGPMSPRTCAFGGGNVTSHASHLHSTTSSADAQHPFTLSWLMTESHTASTVLYYAHKSSTVHDCDRYCGLCFAVREMTPH